MKEKNVTWNEANEKMRNNRERVKFVREQEKNYLTIPERVKHDEDYM